MIVVTGGAGFIGSAVVWALNNRGINDILIVDLMNHTEKQLNLDALQYTKYMDRDQFIERVENNSLEEKVEAIFHLGANSSTTETSVENLDRYNTNYTKTLATYSLDNDTRFIYASSAATYGDGAKGFDDNEDEMEGLLPLNLYGESKQKFDLWAKNEGMLGKIAGLKYFNVFGPNENHKEDMRSVVCKSFKQVNDEGVIRLFKSHRDDYKDGEQVRDFLYVKDAVDMTLFFYDNPGINGIYNIGSGIANTWNLLATSIFKALDKEPNIEYIDMPESIQDKYQYHTKATMNKLKKAGYKQECETLENTVKDYVQNYLITSQHLSSR